MIAHALAILLVLSVPSAASAPEAPGTTVIRIDDVITQETAESVEAAVTKAEGPVIVRINSPGGSVLPGLRIIRSLLSAPGPVICEVEDLAASMAAIILESPGCGVRRVHVYSLIMFHEAAVSGVDTLRQNESGALAERLKAVNLALAALVAPRLGLTVEEYLTRTLGGREIWVVGLYAVSAHVADEVRS